MTDDNPITHGADRLGTGDADTPDPDPRGMGGVELRVSLVNYDDRDADGRPKVVFARQRLTTLELAQYGDRELAEHYVRIAAQNVIDEFRDAEP